jgi:signal transduction histidine kinase
MERSVSRTPAAASPAHGTQENVRDGTLLQKYRELTVRYEALVNERHRRAQGRTDLFAMASWAMESSRNGFALVRKGKLTLSNHAFQKMIRVPKTATRWRRLSTLGEARQPETSHPSLSDFILGEATALSQTEAESDRTFRCTDGQTVLEVGIEATAIEGNRDVVLVVVRDLTRTAALEAEIDRMRDAFIKQERLRALGELALGIAHDVQNVIGAMMMRIALLQRSPASDAAQGANISALARIARSGSAIVERLRSFGSPHQGEDDRDGIDLRTVVQEAVEIAGSGLQLRAGGRPLSIETDVGDLPRVRGSSGEVRRVLVNLLLNAVDAMPNGGKIKIAASTGPNAVILQVQDDGQGIPSDQLARIFEPFYTTKGANGTGMGLAMARSVLTSLGGTISVANRPDASGARFELAFPVSRRMLRSAQTESPAQTQFVPPAG